MALRFADGFDEYTTVAEKWVASGGGGTRSQAIEAAALRTGTYGLRTQGINVQLTLDAQGTWYVGAAFRLRGAWPTAAYRIIQTYDAGTIQGCVRVNTDGTLSLLRSATVVATSASALLPTVWYYIEFKHIIDNAAGTLEVKVNGSVWATFAGDTQATANATANQIYLSDTLDQNGNNKDFDDLYICDGVDQSVAEPGSPANNSYLGDVKVVWCTATGAGTTTGLTPSAGANWQCVDEVPPNTTDYVSDSVVDVYDTYALTDLAVAGNIYGIVQELYAVKMDAGAANVAHVIRSGGTDYTDSDFALSVSWARYMKVRGANPNTAAAFTKANIDALEMGPKVR